MNKKIKCDFTERDLLVLRQILISDTNQKKESLEAARDREIFNIEVLNEIATEIEHAIALKQRIDFYLTS